MASTTSNVPAPPTRLHGNAQGKYEQLCNRTPVRVVWASHPRNIAEPSTQEGGITLILTICYDANTSRASFQMYLRHVVLKKGSNKKNFYLFIPPERIHHLKFLNIQHSTSLDQNTYLLDMVLKEPLDLVGPRSHGYELGWPDTKGKLEQLRSLAGALHFTLYIPTASIPKVKLIDLCEAVSTQEGMRSIADLYTTSRMYGGDGGYVYSAKVTTPLSPEKCPEHLSPNLESDVSTISIDIPPPDLPPEYCGDSPPRYPGAGSRNSDNDTAKAKRQRSIESDIYTPSKRKGDIHGISKATAAVHYAGDTSKEVMHSLLSGSDRQDLIRLAAQNHVLNERVDQLSRELEALKKSHTGLQQQLAASTERLDKTDNVLEALEDQTEALGEDVRKGLPDICLQVQDTIRDSIGDGMQKVVEEMIEDYFQDEIPHSVENLINERVRQGVNERIAVFRRLLDRVFEAAQ